MLIRKGLRTTLIELGLPDFIVKKLEPSLKFTLSVHPNFLCPYSTVINTLNLHISSLQYFFLE